MRLLDVAKVSIETEHWAGGFESDTRACSVTYSTEDPCSTDDDFGKPFLTGAGDGGTVRVDPFTILADLERQVSCSRDDDSAWIRDQLDAATEFGLQKHMADLYLTLAAAPSGTTASEAVSSARSVDTLRIAELVFHVSSVRVPELLKENVLKLQDGDLITVWGDKVAVNFFLNKSQVGFFTGPLSVHLSSIEDVVGRSALQNTLRLQANRLAAVEFDTCLSVRVALA